MILNNFQEKILRISSATKGPAGFAAKSSIRYVERSFELAKSMPEVAVFLAITAEEEAATALFIALKNKKYLHAKDLKNHDHKHKGGLYPFLTLLGAALNFAEIPYILAVNEKEKIEIRLNHGKYCMLIEPPLGLVYEDSSGSAFDYLHAVRTTASNRGIASIFNYIKEIANKRNLVLYANSSSLPYVKNIDSELQRHIGATIIIHIIYILVMQNDKQNLVEECLDIYLKIQKNLEFQN